MAWEARRNGRLYYYRKVREGRRVRSVYVGSGLTPGQRVFQTMRRLKDVDLGDKTGTATDEEFHYQYNGAGQLLQAAFAQEPTRTAAVDGEWYSSPQAALTRARAAYFYDGGGRITDLRYLWDTARTETVENELRVIDYGQGTPTTADDPVRFRQMTYAYGTSGHAYQLGLRTQANFYVNGSSTPQYTETYGYSTTLDTLTSTSYSDQSSWNGSWTYDASGNRANSGYSYDRLNRMTDSPFVDSYTHDAVGNRMKEILNNTETHFGWDGFNRLNNFSWGSPLNGNFAPSISYSYKYRPDGMRLSKIRDMYNTEYEEDESSYYDENLATNMPTWQYAYDGQMLVEDQWTRYEYGHYLTKDVTRYGIGARGIDMIENQRMSGPEQPNPATPQVLYPIYDGHGNMVATLAKSSAAPYFAVGNERRFDAWGQVRTGSGGPVQKYCANLGHLEDGESGLTYMRARYYEPWTGRFISEDPKGDGVNWYVYCDNNPVSNFDASGTVSRSDCLNLAGNLFIAIGLILMDGGIPTNAEELLDFGRGLVADAITALGKQHGVDVESTTRLLKAVKSALSILELVTKSQAHVAFKAIMAVSGYNYVIMGQLMLTLEAFEDPMGGGAWWGYDWMGSLIK